MRTLAGLCAVLLLSACVASGEALAPPQTVDQVDLSRYQGTWYELARLPMFFQRNCAQSEAHYRLREDGRVDVINRCRTLDGEWIEVREGLKAGEQVVTAGKVALREGSAVQVIGAEPVKVAAKAEDAKTAGTKQ
mgnify:CR=1 FL=1